MSEWVQNFLQITHGNPNQIFDFMRSEANLFDFNKLLPMPSSLKVESSIKGEVAVLCAEGNGLGQWASFPWVQERGITTPAEVAKYYGWDYADLINFGNQLLENERRYGAPTWYEWCSENWGTYFNACDAKYYGSDVISFATAWDPPIPVFDALAHAFPGHEFEVDSEDWSRCIYLTCVAKNGELAVIERSCDCCSEDSEPVTASGDCLGIHNPGTFSAASPARLSGQDSVDDDELLLLSRAQQTEHGPGK